LTIKVFNLVHAQARSGALQAVKEALEGHQVTVGPPKRTKAQNRRYWGRGVLAQIADQVSVFGKKYSAESWHEMFKRRFLGVLELPSGDIVGKSSANLNKSDFSEFSQKVEAYAATELGVIFVDLYEG
jgi:hypothetical protein